MFYKLLAEDVNDKANKWTFKCDKELQGGLKMKFWTKPTENGLNMSRAEYIMPKINTA
jgi:hypothetical protein